MAQKATKYYTKENSERKWRIIDADGKVLGRLAVEIANALRGKDKALFTPNQDCGDFVVVINAEKVKVTGDKLNQKIYHRHSGFNGMLPHNRLSDRLITKLKIYAGQEHPHEAQLAAAK